MRFSKKYRIDRKSVPDLAETLDDPVFCLCSNREDERSLLAIGAIEDCKVQHSLGALTELQEFLDKGQHWYFGYLSYDLKNEVEPQLSSNNEDHLDFPLLHFIRPRTVAIWQDVELIVHTEVESELDRVYQLFRFSGDAHRPPNIELDPQITHAHYLRDIMSLQGHIQQGDIYEVNYCMQFGKEASISPFHTWKLLNEKAQAPFSAFVATNPHYLLCASPERFLKREGQTLISQPIKGTKKRSDDPARDAELVRELREDPKERSENIMITDLVRNDLSRSALKGTVRVEELCEIYSFETVHQMISTVTAEIEKDLPFTTLIRDTFPMGSMTGAPKVRAMELIEEHEKMKRGIYSGAVGYIEPDGDFDFNVVIRSLLYNAEKPYLSAMVGGAITSGSLPEAEYEECLLKAQALFQSLK